ncbi:fucose-1-phosphate guanylyltransferase-like [Dreissena polymorpha]|uniref:GDP-fucose pyrophosphorylase domain-containing protein n=1 Tax=Dreissena polymorpha TaxID=45954 RepID=A0A9D4K923_DREPO|nr:fucose-1-phosphate guanylyltransferase-like [Dreissena polymorpha]KAH3835218.1 hypothetical protein DPMN_108566 [Dreissena polymorpha]
METYFSEVISSYARIRGKHKKDFSIPFWDVIVLTAMDDEQKAVYDKQLKYKYEREELPFDVPIHVTADPPGPKIGNGGSTFVSLQFLYDLYSERLFDFRVLLIHAGGQSQRMPSASVLGKIFSPIPKGKHSMYEMLDIKLATFCPLIPKMCPGIFVTCADDFLVYTLGNNHEGIEFASEGFTALAHPSTLEVGVGHGVYVFDKVDLIDPRIPLQRCNCHRVLQKPSIEIMIKNGAVLENENMNFAEGIKIEGKAAYTDSSFFFAHDVTKLMLNFLKSNGPIQGEIDAYGDFLQALGPGSTNEYTSNMANVSACTPKLKETRDCIYTLLKGTPLVLMVMNASKFIHIGTTKEYIEHFCCDAEFQEELGLGKDVFNMWAEWPSGDKLNERCHDDEAPPIKKFRLSDTSLGCVMHSRLPLSSFVARTAVVEYCKFLIPVTVGQNCILSNCEFTSLSASEMKHLGISDEDLPKECISIPPNVFMHTVPVQLCNETQFVTVFFDLKENLKKSTNSDDIQNLPFLGKVISDFARVTNANILSDAPDLSDGKSKVNLWFSSLFPAAATPSQSFILALFCINALKTDDDSVVSLEGKSLFSMASLLKTKDVHEMLKKRNDLYQDIKHGFC